MTVGLSIKRLMSFIKSRKRSLDLGSSRRASVSSPCSLATRSRNEFLSISQVLEESILEVATCPIVPFARESVGLLPHNRPPARRFPNEWRYTHREGSRRSRGAD